MSSQGESGRGRDGWVSGGDRPLASPWQVLGCKTSSN